MRSHAAFHGQFRKLTGAQYTHADIKQLLYSPFIYPGNGVLDRDYSVIPFTGFIDGRTRAIGKIAPDYGQGIDLPFLQKPYALGDLLVAVGVAIRERNGIINRAG